MDVIPALNFGATAKIGVWLFFVLSAYLLAGRLVGELEDSTVRGRVILAYAVRRVLRIMPAYFVFLFGATALGYFRMDEALRHAFLMEGRDHLWTIPVEMAFYALLPIIALILSRCSPRQRPWLTVVVVIAASSAYAVLASQAIQANSMQFPAYALFFAFGILVAQSRMGLSNNAALGIALASMAAIVLLAPRSMESFVNISVQEALGWSWAIGLGWAAILYALTRSSPLQYLFRNSALRFYGRISFSLYLTHFYLINAVAANMMLPGIVKGAVTLVLATVVATGMYLAVEVPGLRLGGRLARAIMRSGSAIAPRT